MLSVFLIGLGFLLLLEGFFLFVLPEVYFSFWRKVFKKESWQESISNLQNFPLFLWRVVGLLEGIFGLFLVSMGLRY
jgi:uncharacterized protein YjeT (DUF2065 family)